MSHVQMKKYLLMFGLVFSSAVNADVASDKKHEIDHLVGFVKTSSCQIIRNGQQHDGNEAIAHIQKKYNYYRDKISSAEQFIEYSATKSTMSKKYYMVACGDQQPIKAKDWLLIELKKYREDKNT